MPKKKFPDQQIGMPFICRDEAGDEVKLQTYETGDTEERFLSIQVRDDRAEVVREVQLDRETVGRLRAWLTQFWEN